ncbi:MAG: enoyl-CoA hydratase-related protein, partial [Acidobacteriota bacterium]
DRPEKRNALSPALLEALDREIDRALGDPDVRSLVVTGRGPAFCAGADLELAQKLAASPGRNPFASVLQKLQASPKPVIAAVNGAAFGGGLGLIAAADIAVASEGAVFSFSEVRLGLIPAMISVFVLPKIGAHHARRLFTTGRRFTAGDALDVGLLHRVVPAAELTAAVDAEADDIALGGPRAVAAAKRLVFEIPALARADDLGPALDRASELFTEAVEGEEGREGLAAFAAKRPPAWRR